MIQFLGNLNYGNNNDVGGTVRQLHGSSLNPGSYAANSIGNDSFVGNNASNTATPNEQGNQTNQLIQQIAQAMIGLIIQMLQHEMGNDSSGGSPTNGSPSNTGGNGGGGYSPSGTGNSAGNSSGANGNNCGSGDFGGPPPGGNGQPITSLPAGSGNVQTWQNTGSAQGKQTVHNALQNPGNDANGNPIQPATPQEEALIQAMGMQETSDFNPAHRDASKDGTDEANYGAFNLNKYELQKLGYTGDPNALNSQQGTAVEAKLLLQGIRNLGADEVMDLTRNGQSADSGGGGPYNSASWRNGQYAAANALLARGPQAFTDDSRTAATPDNSMH